jgi:CO/xanthine dehydrogenase Mo-binding subunit
VFVPEANMETGGTGVVKFAPPVDAGSIVSRAMVDGQIHGGFARMARSGDKY